MSIYGKGYAAQGVLFRVLSYLLGTKGSNSIQTETEYDTILFAQAYVEGRNCAVTAQQSQL
jgi:hypothetical protein